MRLVLHDGAQRLLQCRLMARLAARVRCPLLMACGRNTRNRTRALTRPSTAC
jgi:hypothetical protein